MDAFPELLKHLNLITGADTNLQLIKDTIETIRTTVILEEIPEELLNHDTLILKHAVIFEENLTAELVSIIVNDICCPLFPFLYKLSKSIGANILALYKKCMEQHPPEEENYMIRMLSRSISVYIHEGVMNTADNNANSKHKSECINIDTVLDIILVYPQICISEDHTLMHKLLFFLQHGTHDVLTNKIIFTVFSKLLQQCELRRNLLDHIWILICKLFDDTVSVVSRNCVYSILCGLSTWYLPMHWVSSDDSVYLLNKETFWVILQEGLYNNNPLKRKESLYMLKVIL